MKCAFCRNTIDRTKIDRNQKCLFFTPLKVLDLYVKKGLMQNK